MSEAHFASRMVLYYCDCTFDFVVASLFYKHDEITQKRRNELKILVEVRPRAAPYSRNKVTASQTIRQYKYIYAMVTNSEVFNSNKVYMQMAIKAPKKSYIFHVTVQYETFYNINILRKYFFNINSYLDYNIN